MNNVRWLVLGVTVGLALSLVPACGLGAACGPQTCAGCCDATGVCVETAAVSACGLNGVACGVCTATQACVQGGCAEVNAAPQDSGVPDAGSSAALPTNPLAITMTINPDPPRTGLNVVTATVKGANGLPVTGATVKATFMMPSMPGMGTGHANGTEVDGGVYTISGVNFTMAGDWKVTVTATSGLLAGTGVQMYYP